MARGKQRGAAKRDLIIVVNPGSTSTKVAVYRGEACLESAVIEHLREDLAQFGHILDQHTYRRDAVMRFLTERGIDFSRCMAVAGRGGIGKPILGGVYRVNAAMLADMHSDQWGEHPSRLGPLMAEEIAEMCSVEAFVADPPGVDEMWPLARYAGHPAMARKSQFHALSERAAARRAARELRVSYEKVNLIVVHMGGGISVGAHRKGRVVDVNGALDGDGPFSPERSGSLPTGDLVRLCFSGKHSYPEVRKMLAGAGGMYAHLGTNDCREVERRIDRGDAKAREVYEAMAYQIAKWVGVSATVLSGRVKAVVFTGPMGRSRLLMGWIRKYAGFVAPFLVYPDNEEMDALAAAARDAAMKKIKVQVYR